jgi:glycine cleavage system H protein
MKEPDLKYSKDHEWVGVEGDVAYVGITNYAQEQLGDIVYVELPEVDMEVEKDEAICSVESVKTASDVYAPLTGKIIEVNEELEDSPELINEDPYSAWIYKLQINDETELDMLMNQGEYKEYSENEG